MNYLNFRKYFKDTNFLFFIFSLMLVLYVRLRLLDIPFERDEGEYAYAGQSLLKGLLPYRDFYNMKMPNAYFAFALIIKYLGHHAIAIRSATIVINLINSFLVYKIAKTRLQAGESMIALSVYLLLSLTYEAQGWVSNSEHFVLLPALLGIYALSLFENAHNSKQYFLLFLSGIGLTTALLTKQHAFGFLIFAGLWIAFMSWENAQKSNLGNGSFLKTVIIRYLSFGIGCLVPALVLGIYLYKNNLFEPFYFLTFKYASAYVSIVSPPLKYISNFRPIFANSMVHWITFFAGIRILSFSKWAGKISSNLEEARYLRVYLLLFIICSFVCVCPGLYFRPHYFQLMFPASALIMALGMGRCADFWVKTSQKWQLTPQKLQVLGLLAFIGAQLGYLFLWTPHKIVLDMYGGDACKEMREIGITLGQLTKPTDKIGILGGEPQIWFYANRTAAAGFLYHDPLVEHQPYAIEMSNQYIQEMEKARPEIFIYSTQISHPKHNLLRSNELKRWKINFCKDYELIGKAYKDQTKSQSPVDLRWKHLNQDLSRDTFMIAEIFKRK
jgi:Dolichyl-phosphate-mannose-protein mannosyltransferase